MIPATLTLTSPRSICLKNHLIVMDNKMRQYLKINWKIITLTSPKYLLKHFIVKDNKMSPTVDKLENNHITFTLFTPLSLLTLTMRDRREQTIGQNCKKIVKNVRILEFSGYIWNHHEKCIEISTNKPRIGSVICEIGFEF